MSAAERGDGNRFEYEFDVLGRVANVTGPMGFAETYVGASVPGTQSASVTIPEASAGEDSYERESTGAELYQGFSFEDRDGQKSSEKEKPDRTFETRLPGGAVVTGLMTASDEWGELIRHTYDEVGRLETVTTELGTTTYYYDENGNRYPDSALSKASYDDQDRIEQYGSVTFESTAAGDVVRKSGTADPIHANGREGCELVYSPLGALERANVPGTGDTVTYETDPFGRRVGRKLNGGKPKGWIYTGGPRIIAEVDNNAARTVFIYGTQPTVPELIVKAGKTYRLITDHLGSVRLVVDIATGTVAQRLDYDRRCDP